MVDIARVRRKARAQKTAPRSETVAEGSVPAEAAKPLPTPAETPSAPSSTARVEVSAPPVAEPLPSPNGRRPRVHRPRRFRSWPAS